MSDEANNSDNFSQDNDDRHRDSSRHSEERLRDDRDDRSPLRSPRHHDRRSPLSRSRSRSPRRSRSPSRGTGDRELEDIFSKYGKVLKAQIMYDPHTRDSREINGRILTVEKARRARARTPTPGRYYGPPKRREPRKVDRFDPRYEYSRSYDRYERPPRGYGRDPYYDRAYDRPYYDRGYERGYDRAYDRTYDRAYDRDRRPPPPARYEPYPRPRSPY
ncbi:unnamed protein product [Rhizophagus irregularis]|nr:unnamed protein product [Rhizophagus irregularis]